MDFWPIAKNEDFCIYNQGEEGQIYLWLDFRWSRYQIHYALLFFRYNVPLKGFDKHGRKVIILKGGNADPTKSTMADQFKTSMMVNELGMKELKNQGRVTRFLHDVELNR